VEGLTTISQIARFIRWQDWGTVKLTLVWSLSLYIAVAYELAFEKYALSLIVFLIFVFNQFTLSFVLNNWGDRDLDRKEFRNNPFKGKTPLESVLILTLLAIIAFVSGLPLILLNGFALLWIGWLTSAAAYALNPLRLKTKGFGGVIAAVAAYWFLPVLITFSAFEVAGSLDMWLFALAYSIIGVTGEIGQQRFDRARDRLANVSTFASQLSEQAVDRLYAALLFLEQLAVGLIVLVVVQELRSAQDRWAMVFAFLITCSYLVLLSLSIGRTIACLRKQPSEWPYYSRSQATKSLLFEILLNLGLPICLGAMAALRSPLYAFILGLYLVFRVVTGGTSRRLEMKSPRLGR
jgi:4-hydroxybenzoate polyprenyltransferase